MDTELITLLPAAFALAGSLLGVASKLQARKELAQHVRSALSSGAKVLLVFGFIVTVFGVAVIVKYWRDILGAADLFMFATGLFLTMIGGMFVQVLTANYRAGRSLVEVSATQLIFPLLFSLIVFYPIWSLAASAPCNLFSFYAAFLNAISGRVWSPRQSARVSPHRGVGEAWTGFNCR